jgi:hypothetical protein
MEKYILQDFLKIKNQPSQLKDMVVSFLEKEGGNNKLSKIILGKSILEIKLSKIKLSELKRKMGPKEEKLLFSENKEDWNRRVESFAIDIKNGYEPLPLIITNFWSKLDLSDGSHRHAALEKLGVKEYWAVYLFESNNSALL